MEAAQSFFDGRAGEAAKILGPTSGILAFVNLATLNPFLEFVLLSLSIAFLLWRWHKAATRKGRDEEE